MKVFIDGIPVYFPFNYMYPEQYIYMCELKRALDAKGHCVLEMPTGTGKTVTLLSFICSYQLIRPEVSKLIYCTRTVGEMDKVLHELKRVLKYRNEQLEKQGLLTDSMKKLLAVGLTTRRNLCLNASVSGAESREEADSKCRSMTASWVRAEVQEIDEEEENNMDVDSGAGSRAPQRRRRRSAPLAEDDEELNDEDQAQVLCKYYEKFEKQGRDAILPSGVYGLDDMMEFAKTKGWCPYYTARHAINTANVVVYNYQYLLDPKIAGLISKELARESVVVFDEAHNIDNVCIEALSVNLRHETLNRCLGNLSSLSSKIRDMKDTDANRLQEEYNRLLTSLTSGNLLPPNRGLSDAVLAAPVLPEDIREEGVPGNLRKAEHFVMFVRRLLEYVREKMHAERVVQESARMFSHQLVNSLQSDTRTLRFCSERLKSLLFTLEITNVAEFTPLQLLCDFATLLGTYGHTRSFGVIFEPFDERLPSIPDPILQLACLDASLGMKPVFDRFQSVVLTSGTISPMDMYSKILGFNPVVSRSLTMSLARKCICPMIVSRGPDQQPISSKFELRSDKSVVRNYGNMVIEFAAVVPDGVVVFFVSYIYMESVIQQWNDTGILSRIAEHKLIFIETPDTIESSLALDNYRRACDQGRGAVFLCVARGKVAEGIDFDQHYGRCVIMLGVPFQYTESRVLRARLEYMREVDHIRENEYLSFDAMRQAAQCIGRVIRSKADYGIMVLADKRYVRADKKNKLPSWILSLLEDRLVDLDSEVAIGFARAFLKELAQPLPKQAQLGTALLSEQDLANLSQAELNRSMQPFAMSEPKTSFLTM